MGEEKRRVVRKKEIETLRLLYDFRFVTVSLVVANGLYADLSNARRQLRRLYELGLVGYRYDISYKIDRRPGSYYLLKEGVKVLRRAGEEISSDVTRLIYKDTTASDAFVEHCHYVLEVAIRLKRNHSESFRFIPKSELYDFDNVPRPLPEGFVDYTGNDHTSRAFIEVLEATTPGFAVIKRIKQYEADSTESEWEEAGATYPAIILVAPTDRQLHAIRPKVVYFCDSAGSELAIYGISMDTLRLNSPSLYTFKSMTTFENISKSLSQI